MKSRKVISLFLSLSMMASLMMPGTLVMPTYANTKEENSMQLKKTAIRKNNDTYTITLEAYATGSKVVSETKKDKPTDIILVLDQSGSMTEPMSGYKICSNKSNEDLYRQDYLYYQIEEGKYVAVSVKRQQSNYKAFASDTDNLTYYYYCNNGTIYVRNNGEYQKIRVERSGSWNDPNAVYTYTFPDGDIITSTGRNNSPDFSAKGVLYYYSRNNGEYIYTYTYKEQNGYVQTIGTSVGDNTQPEFAFYEPISRLDALKDAVAGFVDSVRTKAVEGSVGHRIAVVGFATGNTTKDYNYPIYENTEVFVGANQYQYNIDASAYYKSALQDMKSEEGYNNVMASQNALAARGATYPNYGLEMAKGILDADPLKNEERNRVVILFTDGVPGYSGFDKDVANSAINNAKALKDAKVTVYSVGIFEGADANSAGDQNGKKESDRANWFMQQVSSNKDGKPQDPGYYLSAADADTLNNIFQQISQNIEDEKTSTTLDSNAVIKDIISPQFQLPADATVDDIKLNTYSYIGEKKWSADSKGAMGAKATIEGGNKVNVTGFDFAANWCGTETDKNGTTYRGHKLVISFDVKVKDGFLGGNGVFTNESAGVYENSSAKDPLFLFERPTVDVAIKEIEVTPEEKNVYLMGSLTAEQIKAGATVKSGNVELNLGVPDYGLDSWQDAYVNIAVSYLDAAGNEVTNLEDLKEDTTYKVRVQITPKEEGTISSEGQTGIGTGNIYVFKPELTYKDGEVYYGGEAPTDFSDYLVSTIWKHGDTASTDANVTIIGTAPTLNFEYKTGEGVDADHNVNTKKDIPVSVDVRVDGMPEGESLSSLINFVHENCKSDCSWNNENNHGNPAFLLHVKTCQLTVTKTGGADGEPYVFIIKKGDKKYSEITIVGNDSKTIYELPVGTYTIEEDTGWSWRYDVENYSEDAILSSKNPLGTITCTNKKNPDKDKWLNDFSTVVKNVFGTSH